MGDNVVLALITSLDDSNEKEIFLWIFKFIPDVKI